MCILGIPAMHATQYHTQISTILSAVTMDEVEDRIRTMPMSDLGSNPSYGVRGV